MYAPVERAVFARLSDIFFAPAYTRRYNHYMKQIDAPSITPSMRIVLEDLDLDHLWVICPGQHRFDMHEKFSAMTLQQIVSFPVET